MGKKTDGQLRECADGSWLITGLPELDRPTSVFDISMEICEGDVMSVNQPLFRHKADLLLQLTHQKESH